MTEARPSSIGWDVVDAIRSILSQSMEPMTVLKIRARLPEAFRAVSLDELTDVLQRQVAAHVLVICPKYRSAQDRYWDRSLREHAKLLLRDSLRGGPMSWSDLRKRFPKYLRYLADSILNEELARGTIFRHPPSSSRRGPRYALQPADVRTYANTQLQEMMARLEQCGFARTEAREAIMQLLQDDEWAEFSADAHAATTLAPQTCPDLLVTPMY